MYIHDDSKAWEDRCRAKREQYQRDANVRLIAELVEALEAFICPILAERVLDPSDSYSQLPDNLRVCDGLPATYGDFKKALGIIARARGQS